MKDDTTMKSKKKQLHKQSKYNRMILLLLYYGPCSTTCIKSNTRTSCCSSSSSTIHVPSSLLCSSIRARNGISRCLKRSFQENHQHPRYEHYERYQSCSSLHDLEEEKKESIVLSSCKKHETLKRRKGKGSKQQRKQRQCPSFVQNHPLAFINHHHYYRRGHFSDNQKNHLFKYHPLINQRIRSNSFTPSFIQHSRNQIEDEGNFNDDDDDINTYMDDDNIDNLIIPDLATLLSSIGGSSSISNNKAKVDSTKKEKSSNKNTMITNNNNNKILNQLAPAESIAYFYLQNTIGLSSETMWKITNNVGSVLGFTVTNLKTKISFLTRIMDLSQKDIRDILTKQPSILHLSPNRNLSGKILFLVRYLDLSKSELRQMVVEYPCILCYSMENLKKKIHFFESIMGFRRSYYCDSESETGSESEGGSSSGSHNARTHGGSLNIDEKGSDYNELRELLVKNPKLFTAAVDGSYYERMENWKHPSYDSDNEIDFLDDWDDDEDEEDEGVIDESFLEEEEDFMNDNNMNTAMSNSRKRYTTNVSTGSGGMIAKFKFLHNEMAIPKDELRDLVQRNPNVLFYSLQQNLQPKLISLFIMRLRMDSLQIRKILNSFPSIIDYNLDNHLLPITSYFLNELECSPMELRSIVLKFPKVYSHSLFKVKHVVGYLRYGLGMDALQVKRILFQAPQVISLNTDETLLSKVEFIRDAFGLGLKQQHVQYNEKVVNASENEDGVIDDSSLSDIRKVVSGMPTLLLCSVEKNLQPKAEYLLEEFGGDVFELRQAVLTLPTLLGYSLEKRIKPRMERILEAGLEPIKITVGITMKEEKFDTWLNNQRLKVQGRSKSFPSKSAVVSLLADLDNDDDTLDGVVEPKGAIVLFNNGQNNETIGNSRIIHWKR